jgi:hypothetical protein
MKKWETDWADDKKLEGYLCICTVEERRASCKRNWEVIREIGKGPKPHEIKRREEYQNRGGSQIQQRSKNLSIGTLKY